MHARNICVDARVANQEDQRMIYPSDKLSYLILHHLLSLDSRRRNLECRYQSDNELSCVHISGTFPFGLPWLSTEPLISTVLYPIILRPWICNLYAIPSTSCGLGDIHPWSTSSIFSLSWSYFESPIWTAFELGSLPVTHVFPFI